MKSYFTSQFIPIIFSFAVFLALCIVLFAYIHLLNLFPLRGKVFLQLRPADILVGLTIYLKTAIDFALFIGTLIYRHPGVKKRIAIELGTAFGNGIGALLILTIWTFFKEIPILLVFMILLSSLVLLRMAEEGLEEYAMIKDKGSRINKLSKALQRWLRAINKVFDPLLGKLLPHSSRQDITQTTFWPLFLFSLTIPFLLGLDDFAGYIPLFSIINVFGFAVGVFLGHMLLTASLFAFPKKTAQLVRQPIMLIVGSVVFMGLASWGFVEVGMGILSLLSKY